MHYLWGPSAPQKGLSNEELAVVDDENDFYGKRYWLDHQEGPGLSLLQGADAKRPSRAQPVLARTLLKYRMPPGRVSELAAVTAALSPSCSKPGFGHRRGDEPVGGDL